MPKSKKMKLPPDPKEMNDQRAKGAKSTLLHYANSFGEIYSKEDLVGLETSPDQAHQNLGDLLCDLAHFCDREGVSLADCLATAEIHYNEETANKGQQFA